MLIQGLTWLFKVKRFRFPNRNASNIDVILNHESKSNFPNIVFMWSLWMWFNRLKVIVARIHFWYVIFYFALWNFTDLLSVDSYFLMNSVYLWRAVYLKLVLQYFWGSVNLVPVNVISFKFKKWAFGTPYKTFFSYLELQKIL